MNNGIVLAIVAMAVVVAGSNYAVQFPINDWLTWGAVTYPVSFLVCELTNRAYGPRRARIVVYVGFFVAVLASFVVAPARIALASGTAFLIGQLCDITVFNRLRRSSWWRAPLLAAVLASVVDTALFFSLAFAGTALPWITLALGDLGVKLAMAGLLLVPFRLLLAWVAPWQPAAARP